MGMSLDGYMASDRELVIQPVATGSGQALFGKLTAPLRPDLIKARSFDRGVVVHVYRPRAGS